MGLQTRIISCVWKTPFCKSGHILFDKLYHIYHSSAKNKRELEECSQELSEQFFTVGCVLDNRWVASSFRTIKFIVPFALSSDTGQ